MNIYEYKVRQDLDTEQLSEMGLQGWDNYAIIFKLGSWVFYFKRIKEIL